MLEATSRRRASVGGLRQEMTVTGPSFPLFLLTQDKQSSCSVNSPVATTCYRPNNSTMADAQVFEEIFTITKTNKGYDRVSRIYGTSSDNQITMTLDINHEIFPVRDGDTLNMVLATTLSLDGAVKDQNETMWRNVGKHGVPTLADMYDYVCYGKHYRMEDGEGDTMKYYASFGGLLLYMEGPHKKLNALKIDNIYLLVKHS